MPNIQDEITNPAMLIDLLDQYRERAQDLAYELNPAADDPPPVVSCTIPVKVRGGGTIEVSGAAPEVWADGLLETYVGLPERFRGYWRQMADALGAQAQIVETLDTSNVPGIYGPVTSTDQPYYEAEGEFYGGTILYTQVGGSYSVRGATDPDLQTVPIPNSVPEEPAWSGAWPSGYYYTTFPQLVDAIDLLQYTGGGEVRVPPCAYYGHANLGWSTYFYQNLAGLCQRHDWFDWTAYLYWDVYLRNYSDEDVSVPFSTNGVTGGYLNVYTSMYGNNLDTARTRSNLGSSTTGNIVVYAGETTRVRLGVGVMIHREQYEEILWDDLPELENPYLGLLDPLSFRLDIGDFTLAYTFYPPG